MPRFIHWVISACLAFGVGTALIEQTYEMAKVAVHAHQYSQMSYSKFTKALLNEQARPKANRP